MENAFQNIAGMYIIMIAAYLLKRISPYPVEVVNNLVFNLFLPVTIFYSVIAIPKAHLPTLSELAIFSFVILLVTYVVAAIVVKSLHLSDSLKKTFLLGASYGNHAFLGFPVAYAFLADKGLLFAIFYQIGGLLFLYLIGLAIMTGKINVPGLVKNPLVIALLAGLLCLILRLQLPPFLTHSLSLINKGTFPLAMVVVGGGLRLRFFSHARTVIYTLIVSVIKLIISPFIAFALGFVLALPADQHAIAILQSAMPAAVLVTVFAVQYDGDDVLSTAIVSFTTLVSIGTIPLLFLLLG
jgi:predicted permease